MVWNCLEGLNFKATNFCWTRSKKSLKRKTLIYCNKNKNLLERYLHMHCTVQTQTLLLSR